MIGGVVLKPFLKESLLSPHSTLVVGVSGGMDSMVLLHQLGVLRAKNDYTIIVAHVNHQKRHASMEEEAFVQTYALEHQYPFESTKITVPNQGNFHTKARELRMQFFLEVCAKYRATSLVLAHHQDDQAETVLMRFLRGSHLKGYGGMQATTDLKSVLLIRPLLQNTKAQIKEYLAFHQIPYREDESNAQSIYTRNRLRHEVIPILEKENPNWKQQATHFANLMLETNHYLETQVEQTYLQLISNPNQPFRCEVEAFQKLDAIIQRLLLEKLIRLLSHNTFECSFVKQNQILQMISSSKPNQEMKLNKQYRFVKSYQWFAFEVVTPTLAILEQIIPDLGTYTLPSGDILEVSLEPTLPSGKHCVLWYNDLKSFFPLRIRNRKAGDRLHYPYGSKKLKDALIDKKIPMKQRHQLLLLVNQNDEIVWVPDIDYVQLNPTKTHPVYLSYLQKGSPSC